MHTISAATGRPPITLVDTEADTLSEIALAALPTSSMGARLLLEELDRADVFDRDSMPRNVATMQSKVLFEDEATGRTRRVKLVYPKDADSAHDRVSVTTPIGAALIGMPEGASIEWPNRQGATRRLRILEVTQPDAAS